MTRLAPNGGFSSFMSCTDDAVLEMQSVLGGASSWTESCISITDKPIRPILCVAVGYERKGVVDSRWQCQFLEFCRIRKALSKVQGEECIHIYYDNLTI
jgi:hypothetical protein